ncbi:MAG: universal stress protein, partial [Thermodesulfovibrionia bacterium]|nr:universal stress protein [Thermodesulfovibrionia bacterium]
LGSHGRTGLKRIFMGSVTARVIGHTPCPVMIVKA